ncbi:PAS domain S-box protein [Botryobacter ruber]|uniref:PAS domain S-box protein n=1 Tax=Botryobacter ruber TaxID=2171629 RepID=UPI000E0C65F7|nr:PAS domain S-box protein [Botryobacter ruber]
METTIKILLLEHDQHDLELLQYQIKKAGLKHRSKVVQTREAYETALLNDSPDVILSDYSLPSFDGLSAFHLKQRTLPHTPFIIVSGTIGEEKAVELIKLGVTDYVLKEKLYQVGPKIERALKEAADRKQKETAELQLKQREEQLQKIMDLSLDVIGTINNEGKIETVSAASEVVWGYSPEEMIGTTPFEYIYEEDKEKSFVALAGLKDGIDMHNFENRIIRKNGEPVTMLWSGRWHPADQIGYFTARDITDIKKAEEKIKTNEKRFRTLLQNSTDGFILIAADGTVKERSASAIRILELDESKINSRSRLDLIHPDDLEVFNDTLAHVMQNPNSIRQAEGRFRMPDNSYKWLDVTLHNQQLEPAVGAIVLNFRDITERKLAEIELEKSEEKYRNLFDLNPSPMWVFDVNNLQFIDVNEAAVRLYGYSKDEFLGMTIKDIRPVEELEKLEAVLTNSRSNRFFHDVFIHVKKNGEVIDVDIKSDTVNLGDRIARLVLATDITDQLKHIKAVEEQNKKLREIAWMQSHIVRAPLARIMGIVDLLDNYPPEKVRNKDFLPMISSSAHELDEIIREIVRKAERVKEQPVYKEQPE